MKRRSKTNGNLFIDDSGQLRLVDKSAEQQAIEKSKVECLGMTFDSEDDRRGYFTARLREKLTDPEFRRTPGFPKGTEDDIIHMSDPPWVAVSFTPRRCQYSSCRSASGRHSSVSVKLLASRSDTTFGGGRRAPRHAVCKSRRPEPAISANPISRIARATSGLRAWLLPPSSNRVTSTSECPALESTRHMQFDLYSPDE